MQKHKKAMKLVSGARTKKHQRKVAQRQRLAAKAEEVHPPEGDEVMAEAPKIRKVSKKKKSKVPRAAPAAMQE